MEFLPEDVKSQIQTAAFCGYIMAIENCSKERALERMAKLCTIVQVSLGLGNMAVRHG